MDSRPLYDDNYPTSRETTTGLQNTPLIMMAVDGDFNGIRWMLHTYSNVSDYIDLQDLGVGHRAYENTALILATMGGHTDIAIELIDFGANVNLANNYDITPLHYACLLRDDLLIRKLLSMGADWDKMDLSGVTPLDLYLYDFDRFPVLFDVVKELILIDEHLGYRTRLITTDRPIINVELLSAAQLTQRQVRIPELIKPKISACVQKFSPIFYANNPDKFQASIFPFAFINHTEFLEVWNRVKSLYVDDQQKTEMFNIVIDILNHKYGLTRGSVLEMSDVTSFLIPVKSAPPISTNMSDSAGAGAGSDLNDCSPKVAK